MKAKKRMVFVYISATVLCYSLERIQESLHFPDVTDRTQNGETHIGVVGRFWFPVRRRQVFDREVMV